MKEKERKIKKLRGRGNQELLSELEPGVSGVTAPPPSFERAGRGDTAEIKIFQFDPEKVHQNKICKRTGPRPGSGSDPRAWHAWSRELAVHRDAGTMQRAFKRSMHGS